MWKNRYSLLPSENGGDAVRLRVVPEEHHAVPRNAAAEKIPSVSQIKGLYPSLFPFVRKFGVLFDPSVQTSYMEAPYLLVVLVHT